MPRDHHFYPDDGCLHGKYCARYAMFLTTRPHNYNGPVCSVEVPAGTPTDFASVPWPFTLFFPNVGPYARAALFHDQLYRETLGDRATADALFLALMQIDHTPWWQRYPMYLAVRMFGWIYWNRNQRRKQPPSKLKLNRKTQTWH